MPLDLAPEPDGRNGSGVRDEEAPLAEGLAPGEAEAFARRLVEHREVDFGYLYLGDGPRYFSDIAASSFYYPNTYEPDVLRETAGTAFEGTRLSTLVDLGSGGSEKFTVFLPAFEQPVTYVPCDFADRFLRLSSEIAEARPEVGDIRPTFVDLREPEISFSSVFAPMRRKAFLLLGSTLCNFSFAVIQRIVTSLRDVMHEEDRLVIVADQPLAIPTMLAAYDDEEGVTARFNRHLLGNLNERFGTTFDASEFEHDARWNSNEGRIEMHLVATVRQEVAVGDRVLHLAEGESILTEWSYKFSRERFTEFLGACGLGRVWSSPNAVGPIAYVASRCPSA